MIAVNKRQILLAGAVLVILGALAAVIRIRWQPETSAVPLTPPNRYGQELGMSENREALLQFISSQMTGPYGVYTNWQDTDQSRAAATGHEILSESASLMLRSLALSGQPDAFGASWAQAKKTFDREKLFSYRYAPKLGKQYPVNAAVDDLRFVRALYEAGRKFGDDRYTKEADRYGKRLYQYNVKDGYLHEFYDEASGSVNAFITLCYIDLRTLKLLPVGSGDRDALVSRMLNIAKGGYISDVFPFYETRYNYETRKYSSDNINTVESMLTVLELAEVGQEKAASIRFIKDKVREGKLYGQYSRDGAALNDVRSTAIYAIAAMIGSELADRELYEAAVGRMNELRVKAPDSPFYGGFGDDASRMAYSFDNLMALLAYSY